MILFLSAPFERYHVPFLALDTQLVSYFFACHAYLDFSYFQ
jgi:hypothetical protein